MTSHQQPSAGGGSRPLHLDEQLPDPCEVWVSRGDRRVNAKSIMGVMMLAAGLGSEIVIETDGAQEGEAMEALLALLANKFGEGE